MFFYSSVMAGMIIHSLQYWWYRYIITKSNNFICVPFYKVYWNVVPNLTGRTCGGGTCCELLLASTFVSVSGGTIRDVSRVTGIIAIYCGYDIWCASLFTSTLISGFGLSTCGIFGEVVIIATWWSTSFSKTLDDPVPCRFSFSFHLWTFILWIGIGFLPLPLCYFFVGATNDN